MNHLISFYIIFAILILIFAFIKSNLTYKESFLTQFCTDCHNNGWTDQHKCNHCVNCGWSIGWDDFGQCIPGTISRPILDNNTQHWYYRGRKIWSRVHPRYYTQQTQPHPHNILIHSPRLKQVPFWDFLFSNRAREGVGHPRFGRRFGKGLNKLKIEEST